MDRVWAGEIGVPTVRQSFYYGVCTPETCCLLDKLMVGGMLGITQCDVVFNLGGDFFERLVVQGNVTVRRTDTGNNV